MRRIRPALLLCLATGCAAHSRGTAADGGAESKDGATSDAHGRGGASADARPPPADSTARDGAHRVDAALAVDAAVRDASAPDGAEAGESPPDASGFGLPAKRDAIRVLRLVNDRFIADHPDTGSSGWARAVYFVGNSAAYDVTSEKRYMDYAIAWVTAHGYGIDGDPTFADNQCVGQTYEWLSGLTTDATLVAGIQMAIDPVVAAKDDANWYWVDALFMAMPTFAWLGAHRYGPGYLDEMYRLYTHTKSAEGGSGLWSDTDGLWWRDKNFLPPVSAPNGKRTFWGRGNGWAMAAHARVLDVLPPDDAHRAEYLSIFGSMATAVARVQRDDGCWNPSLLDPNDFGSPEASATSLFAYSFAWAIRNAVLDRATYAPVVARAYRCLVDQAVSADGRLGWVQGVGVGPASSQPVTATSTSDFGVGTFLLAAAEISRITL